MAERCGAATRSGGTCAKPAGWGTPQQTGKCKLHGGSTRNHIIRAQNLKAALMAQTYGVPVDSDPREALARMLNAQHGVVQWLEIKVSELAEHEVFGPVGGGPEAIPSTEMHVLIRQLGVERDRLRQVAVDCAKVGVEERRVAIAEAQGEQLAVVMRQFARLLGHDPQTDVVQQAARRALLEGSVDSTAEETA